MSVRRNLMDDIDALVDLSTDMDEIPSDVNPFIGLIEELDVNENEHELLLTEFTELLRQYDPSMKDNELILYVIQEDLPKVMRLLLNDGRADINIDGGEPLLFVLQNDSFLFLDNKFF